MSETIITETIRDGNGVLTDVDSIVFRDPTGAFGVRRTDTLAIVVAAGVALTHVSTGVYRYVITDPAPNINYQYWIRAEYLGEVYEFEKERSGATGGGVAPETIPDALPRSCIGLARYAKLTGYSECALNGVAKEGEVNGECDNPLWTQYQRDTLLYYLAEAQSEIENVTGYPLCPTYFTDEFHSLRTQSAFPIHSRWMKVLAAGVRAETDIQTQATIDYSVEPALIGSLATSVTDVNEIHVFYPGSEREIEPSKVTIAGGSVQIWIPRCRLVTPDAFDTPQGGLDYTDLTNFLEVADVKRVYTDSNVNAEFVYAHRETVGACPHCGCATCGEATEDACLYVANPATGALDALRATNTGGVWTVNRNCYDACPTGVRVNYLAGLSQLTAQLETAVLRLAHSLMPVSPCGCDVFRSLWERDTHVPDFISPEREASSFGWSDGAFFAWKQAHAPNVQSRRASVL